MNDHKIRRISTLNPTTIGHRFTYKFVLTNVRDVHNIELNLIESLILNLNWPLPKVNGLRQMCRVANSRNTAFELDIDQYLIETDPKADRESLID